MTGQETTRQPAEKGNTTAARTSGQETAINSAGKGTTADHCTGVNTGRSLLKLPYAANGKKQFSTPYIYVLRHNAYRPYTFPEDTNDYTSYTVKEFRAALGW